MWRFRGAAPRAVPSGPAPRAGMFRGAAPCAAMFRRAAPCAAICLGAIAAFLTCSPAHGQSLVEGAAAAAGGSVGGIAGKKVSDGLTNIFEKIDKQTAKAAKTGDTKSALK